MRKRALDQLALSGSLQAPTQRWICLASSSIPATPPQFNWSFVPPVHQILISRCSCWYTASDECQCFSIVKSANQPSRSTGSSWCGAASSAAVMSHSLITARKSTIFAVASQSQATSSPLMKTTISAGVENCFHQGLTGDFEHLNVVYSDKTTHMRERAVHANRQSHRLEPVK